MRKGAVLVLFVLGCLPTRALADGITCIKTGSSSVTVMESADETGENGSEQCDISGVPLPLKEVLINILENPLDPEFDSNHPLSDTMNISKEGHILLHSDSDEKGLDRGSQAADIEVTEPVGFGPVEFEAGGTTYTVFSDVAPEPTTILLFGSGLLALFARRKKH